MHDKVNRGEIVWTINLDAVTTTTSFPSSATDGIAVPSDATLGRMGDRCHVKLRYQVGSGTMSTDCHLYGYDASTGWWAYLGSFNGGASITADAKWSESSTAIAIHEHFPLAMGQVSRLATRVIAPQGTTVSISTYIGYERA